MYYLTKFCRICVGTNGTLIDLETLDTDSIKLSTKLEECTKMVLDRESLSKDICIHCVKKLRVSYEFHSMCKKSTKILHGYLAELLGSAPDKIDPESVRNTELRVSVTPLGKTTGGGFRKRITKAERCSILKSLLTTKCDSNPPQSGLRNIINFTRSFDFGFKCDAKIREQTPLDKLEEFSKNFFNRDFTKFRDTILYIIENNHDSDDDDMFGAVEEETGAKVKFEEIFIEPDIKIKTELFTEEDEHCAQDFVEASYEDQIKTEPFDDSGINSRLEYPHYDNCLNNYSYFHGSNYSGSPMGLLNNLVGNINNNHIFQKTFPPHSIRCRTRGNPYINPQLREQFRLRSFQCKKCPRYFKTPGYLKAHVAKIHNYVR